MGKHKEVKPVENNEKPAEANEAPEAKPPTGGKKNQGNNAMNATKLRGVYLQVKAKVQSLVSIIDLDDEWEWARSTAVKGKMEKQISDLEEQSQMRIGSSCW